MESFEEARRGGSPIGFRGRFVGRKSARIHGDSSRLATAAQGKNVDAARRLNARQALDSREQVAIERADLFGLTVFLVGQGNAHGQDALGLEAGPDFKDPDKTFEQKTRSNQ